jgi:hypothetical protein
MAENKKSFLLYCDLIHTVNKMPNEKAGELLKHILSYVNDEEPTTDDLIIQLTFEPIKQSLKRDLVKYEKTRLRNIENINKRWENTKNTSGINRIPNDTKNTVSDSVSDSVSVNDIKENINTPLAFSFYNSLINIGANKELVSDWIKVRKNKKLTNTQTAFNKFISQLEKSGYTINEVLEKCVEKSWGGFDAEWYKKTNTLHPNGIGRTNQKIMTYDD